MSIINCKVANIRPQYQNLKEWINDFNNVYVGRAGVVFIDGQRFPKEASEFCNPFKIGKDGNREQIIAKYKTYIENKLHKDQPLVSKLKALKGKNLGCWCHPEPCHANVLLELIDKYLVKQ